MAADTTHAHSIITQKTDMDKIMELDKTKLINCVELDPGDRPVFMEYVQKNMHLHEYRTGESTHVTPLTPAITYILSLAHSHTHRHSLEHAGDGVVDSPLSGRLVAFAEPVPRQHVAWRRR